MTADAQHQDSENTGRRKARSHTFSRWRKGFASWWKNGRWFVLTGLWILGYTLGCIGLHRLYPERRWVDVLATAFQFRSFGWTAPDSLPWEIEVTRWLLPSVGSFVAIEAFLTVFHDRIREVQSHGLRDHVVICGLSQKGLLLARAFHDSGHRVLVVESNPDNDLLEACKQAGAFVLSGDATQRETLDAARVMHAKYLLAVCDDAANTAIIAHARDITTQSAAPTAQSGATQCDARQSGAARNSNNHTLTCAAHIIDPELWRLLRRWEINATGSLRLQLFNVFDIGARGLLAAHPPWMNSTPETAENEQAKSKQSAALNEANSSAMALSNATQPADIQPAVVRAPHLLVVGAGRLGQRVVLRAARQWLEHGEDNAPVFAANPAHTTASSPGQHAPGQQGGDARLHVVLVDATATAVRELLCQRHPNLAQVCDIEARDLEINSTQFQSADLLNDAQGRCVLSAIYICASDDAKGLAVALGLRRQLEVRSLQSTVPILIRTGENAGLAALLGDAQNARSRPDELDHELRAFGLLEYSCRPELVLGGTGEVLARTLHENYLREQKRLQNSDANNPALADWEQLPDSIKELNRRQADFIGVQLRHEKCDIAPISDWEATPFSFTPEEIERMAQREHERWKSEQERTGWTLGARDALRKTNPYLMSWNELPPDVQEMNRTTARLLPQFLARAGFQIFRL